MVFLELLFGIMPKPDTIEAIFGRKIRWQYAAWWNNIHAKLIFWHEERLMALSWRHRFERSGQDYLSAVSNFYNAGGSPDSPDRPDILDFLGVRPNDPNYDRDEYE